MSVNGQVWEWQVRATKFGSGGKGSEEKLTGADGIVEIEIRHSATGQAYGKGLLLQAKKLWSGNNPRLLKQVRDMETLASGSSAALDYSPEGYFVIAGPSVIDAEGDRRRVTDVDALPLGDFLVDGFLACKVGLRGLHYEPQRHRLYLPAKPGQPQSVALLIGARLRIEVDDLGTG